MKLVMNVMLLVGTFNFLKSVMVGPQTCEVRVMLVPL